MPALKIVRVSHEEDVFAAEETKVHTMSRQVISEMLDTAAREEAKSSAPPPPPSGVRRTEANRPAPTKSGTMPKIPVSRPLPVISNDDDDEGLEPTILHERASLPRQELVTQLMNEPPLIICPEPEPETETEVEIVVAEPAANLEAPPAKWNIDRRAIAITLVTFLATAVPALVVLHHLLNR